MNNNACTNLIRRSRQTRSIEEKATQEPSSSSEQDNELQGQSAEAHVPQMPEEMHEKNSRADH